MKLVDRWDGASAPFEGDRALRLLSLPAGARVTAAAARVEAVAARAGEPFVERIRFPAGGGAGDWGATAAVGAGWTEVDFHGRRTLAGAAGTNLGGALLLVDFGGGIFTPVDPASGAPFMGTGASPTLAGGGSLDLPGLTVSRLRIARTDALRPEVRELRLRSVPANLTLRLGDAGVFWARPGPLSGEAATPDFALVLRAFLEAHPAPEGGYHVVPLDVHADGIARLRVTVEIEYLLEAGLLPPGLPEVALPFDYGGLALAGTEGGALGTGGRMAVALPPGARVLPDASPPRARGAFQDTRVVPGRGPTGAVDPAATARARVSLAFSQAQRVPAGAPAVIAGVDLCLLPRTSAARLQLDLRADLDGSPDPASLLRAPVPFALVPGQEAELPVWVSVALPAEVHLARCRSCWVVVQSLEGEAEWIGVRHDSAAAGALALDGGERCPGAARGPPPLLSTADAGLSWRDSGPLTALFRLRCRPAAFRMPLELEVGEGAGARRVSLSRFDALGRVDFALDTPEVAAALDAAAGEAAASATPHEALANGDFRAWVTAGYGLGVPEEVETGVAATALAPGGERVYVLGSPSADFSVVAFQEAPRDALVTLETATDRVAERNTIASSGGRSLLVDAAGSHGYVLEEADGDWAVRALDLDTFGGGARATIWSGADGAPPAALSPDGATLYLGVESRVVAVPTAALELATGGAVAELPGARSADAGVERVTALALSPDGARLYVGAEVDDGGAGVLRVLEAAMLLDASDEVRLDEPPGQVVVAPGGGLVVCIPADRQSALGPAATTITLVDPAASRSSTRRAAGRVAGAAISPDGRTLFLVLNGADVWGVAAYDVARWREVAAVPGLGSGPAAAPVLTPRGDRLYLVANQGQGLSEPVVFSVTVGVRRPAEWTATASAELLTAPAGDEVWAVIGHEEDPLTATASLAQVAPVAPGTRYTFRFRGISIGGAWGEVFWLDAAGALLRREEAVRLASWPREDDLPPALPGYLRTYTSPPDAAQAEVRFRVTDGAAAVAGASLASSAGVLADPAFLLAPGAPGSGWTVAPAARPGAAIRQDGELLAVTNRGTTAVELAQEVELPGGALALRVDASALALAAEAPPATVSVRWMSAEGAEIGAPAVVALLPGDFEAHPLRLSPPPGAARAEVVLAAPPATELRVREVALRRAPEAEVPVRFIAEAPGELALTGGRIVYDVVPAPAPRVPAGGPALPTPPDRTPGTGGHGAHGRSGCDEPGDEAPVLVARRRGPAPAPAAPPVPSPAVRAAEALAPNVIFQLAAGRIERLADAGIATFSDLASASRVEVAGVLRISERMADRFIADARDRLLQNAAGGRG